MKNNPGCDYCGVDDRPDNPHIDDYGNACECCGCIEHKDPREAILESYINGQFQQCYRQLDDLDGGLGAFLEWGRNEAYRNSITLLDIAIKYAKHKGF